MRQRRPRFVRMVRVRRRRAVNWLERRSGVLLPWIPSWGGSLLLHATALLLLALILYARSGGDHGPRPISGQLLEDLDSLVDADHAGDPFTSVASDEVPSLSLQKTEPEIAVINQPDVSNLARFTPEVMMPEPALAEALNPARSTLKTPVSRKSKNGARLKLSTTLNDLHVEDISAPFSGRSEDIKAKLVRREGGTVRSEKAVQDGLDWLIRHQRPDGSWSLHYHSQCQGSGCPPEDPMETDTAATGLALLPLLGAGHIHTAKSRYQSHVRQGLAWLVEHQDSSGLLYVGQPGMPMMYSHAIATMALCEAYGLSKDRGLRSAAQNAIDFICEAQNVATGGWRYAPGQSGDTSVFGWQMFALRSARLSGLKVPRSTIKGCKSYLDAAAADDYKITYSYIPGRNGTPVMTAEALLSRQYLGWPRDYPPLVKGASMVAADLDGSQDRNIYYWYYATQLLHNMQNKDWERWNLKVREGLIAMQVKADGCDRGSWDPQSPQPDKWGNSGGRLFLTSLSTLCLEVYYRYLPLYQPADKDNLKLDGDPNPSPSANAAADHAP